MKQNIIYIRTSTEDQNPKLQIEDCLNLAEKLQMTDFEIVEDKVSGWKELDRDGFDGLEREVKSSHIKVIICWDLDRLYRNRVRLTQFFQLCKIYNVKIHSVRQTWLEDLNNIPAPFNDITHTLMLNIMGWLAEEESNKKSKRVKLAVVKQDKDGNIIKAVSYKGNKWGRKEVNNKKMIEDIIRLSKEGKTLKEIVNLVHYYDKSNNLKSPSLTLVWKIIKNKS